MYLQGLLLVGSLLGESFVFSESVRECPRPLGMQKGHIIDRQILAKSSKDGDHRASEARLHGASAWCSAPTVRDNYIQIDLWKIFRISGIATQSHPAEGGWVRYYALAYSMDGFEWLPYTEHGEEKIFDGNSDTNTVEYRILSPPIIARQVRVIPVHVTNLKPSCMRLELYGCKRHMGMFCGDPGAPMFGRREGDSFTVGEKLQFSCDPGYEIVGESTLTCTEDGSWDHEPPKCSKFSHSPVQRPTTAMQDISLITTSTPREDDMPKCRVDKNGAPYFYCQHDNDSKRKLKCEEETESEGSGGADDEDLVKVPKRTPRGIEPGKDFFFDNI